MFHWESILEEDISGLEMNEIEFLQQLGHRDPGEEVSQWTGVTVRQQELIDAELSNPSILNNAELLRELTEEEEAAVQDVEEAAKRKSTTDQTALHVKRFKKYLVDQKLPDNIETMPIRYLCAYMRLWFVSLRTQEGKPYAVRSLVCFRASIHRYVLETRNVRIIGNTEFLSFERTYKACLMTALREKTSIGNASTYCPIDDSDFHRLRVYFDRTTPTRLQFEVLFKIVYGFGFRGREWLRGLTKADVRIDEYDGVRYIDLVKDGVEKTVTADDPTTRKSIILAETPTDPNTCPVRAMEMYLAKIPDDVGCLWPKPLERGFSMEGFWYHKSLVLGKHWLNEFMKKMCELAGLSNRAHTNHCIRASVVTNLMEDGVSVSEIQAVTGHKRAESVEHYNKRLKFSKKVNLSRAISGRLSGTAEQTLASAGQSASNAGASSTAGCIVLSQNTTALGMPGSIVANQGVSIGANQASVFEKCKFENCTFNITPR